MNQEKSRKKSNAKLLIIIAIFILLIAFGAYFIFVKPNLNQEKDIPREMFNNNRTGIPPMNRSDPRFNATFNGNQSFSLPPEKPQGNPNEE